MVQSLPGKRGLEPEPEPEPELSCEASGSRLTAIYLDTLSEPQSPARTISYTSHSSIISRFIFSSDSLCCVLVVPHPDCQRQSKHYSKSNFIRTHTHTCVKANF